jgi:hypothetical protein
MRAFLLSSPTERYQQWWTQPEMNKEIVIYKKFDMKYLQDTATAVDNYCITRKE